MDQAPVILDLEPIPTRSLSVHFSFSQIKDPDYHDDIKEALIDLEDGLSVVFNFKDDRSSTSCVRHRLRFRSAKFARHLDEDLQPLYGV